MLMLTRRADERVMIGDDVVITVISIHGDQVRLGFEAPAEVAIDREEIWEAKRAGRGHRAECGAGEAAAERFGRPDGTGRGERADGDGPSPRASIDRV